VTVGTALTDPAVQALDDVFGLEITGEVTPLLYGLLLRAVRAMLVSGALNPVPPLTVVVNGLHVSMRHDISCCLGVASQYPSHA
jgi:hypothetical protein